ncbi:MAG: flagellar type III secretion system pore protein FliP [Hahellaceae bacterium]|nr:flagellar type III secretion system pore protein FliP [Hahellaceae bacterium]
MNFGRLKPLFLLTLFLIGLAAPSWAYAQIEGLPALKLITNPDGTQEYSVTLQVLLLMTAFTFIPAMLMMMTSFTRIVIVFAILRQAIGLQQSPSNQIIIGLSLFLTFFIMAPVFKEANETAIQPYLEEKMPLQEAFDIGIKPLRTFMLAQTRSEDINVFVRLADEEGKYESVETVPLNILLPAFVTSELKTAFQIGFMIFIPFLIIDMVVASVLMAMGMMMLSPMIISLPFKIMLFVMVDGWLLIMGTLAASFGL